MLGSCGEQEKEIVQNEVYSLREIGVLGTTEYTLSKVIHWNDESWFKFGDRKILISCRATVKAGIDLKKMKDSDFLIKGKRIEVTLPQAELLSFEMDPDDIHTEAIDVSGFRQGFSQDEKMKVLQKGEEAILKDIRSLHILDEAERNAAEFIRDFYKSQGFEEVIVHENAENKGNTKLDR